MKDLTKLLNGDLRDYRPVPFWSWNDDLQPEELVRQIDTMKEKGIGGFFMHARGGLKTEYLSERWFDCIRACVEESKKVNMNAWSYDENGWPSGFAGMKLLEDKANHEKYLDKKVTDNFDENATAVYFVGKDNKLIKTDKPVGDGKYVNVYLKTNPSVVDILDRSIVRKFIELTHERYKKECGEDFGRYMLGFFTDEPQFTRKTLMDNSTDTDDLIMPWTDDFAKTYSDTYSQDITEFLPEIFWDLPDGKVSAARYRYHDHIAERFSSAFADTVGGWCRENGIALTGHMMDEPTLESQTGALGEAMRSYRSFGLPGIDMLCSWKEYTTAKQAQSAAHQFGYEGVLSELYGVTDWDFDFRGHKLNGDWQARRSETIPPR